MIVPQYAGDRFVVEADPVVANGNDESVIGCDRPTSDYIEQGQYFTDARGLTLFLPAQQYTPKSSRGWYIELEFALLDHLQKLPIVADDDASFLPRKVFDDLVGRFFGKALVCPNDVCARALEDMTNAVVGVSVHDDLPRDRCCRQVG